MAITIPIISEFADKGISAAEAAFGRFKTKIGEADGAMGKMKAGFGVAAEFVKTNAAQMATVAGTAIAGFAVKAINDFKDLALEVDKFRDVTGFTLDESSRWIEVAGDIDISAETIQKAIGKMEKAADTSLKPFQDLGIEIARFADGKMNPHETFLRVVDALDKIEDPAKRARVASQLLGKGWEELAPLISKGAGEIRTALAGVSDAKIINEDEVIKAEKFRGTMDTLNDVFQDVVLELGGSLIPIIERLADKLLPIIAFVGDATEAIVGPDSFTEAVVEMGGTVDEVVEKLGFEKTMKDAELSARDLAKMIRSDLVPETYALQFAWEDGYRAMIDANDALKDVKGTVRDLGVEYDILKGKINDREAWRNLQETIERAGQAAVTAFKEKTPEALRASEDALDRTRLAAAEYIMKLDGIPKDKRTDIIAALDQASLADIERQLAYLARPRVAGIIVGPGETPSEVRGRGPQSLSITTPGTFGIMPTSATKGGNVIVNVAGSVTTESDLVESIRKGLVNAQRNGAGLVYSNS